MDARELTDKLNEYPALKDRFEELIHIIENPEGRTTLADDAEMCVIEELRELGQDILGQWANKQSNKASKLVEKGMSKQVRKRGKKNSTGTQRTEK